ARIRVVERLVHGKRLPGPRQSLGRSLQVPQGASQQAEAHAMLAGQPWVEWLDLSHYLKSLAPLFNVRRGGRETSLLVGRESGLQQAPGPRDGGRVEGFGPDDGNWGSRKFPGGGKIRGR